jgi:hypothetical protein
MYVMESMCRRKGGQSFTDSEWSLGMGGISEMVEQWSKSFIIIPTRLYFYALYSH